MLSGQGEYIKVCDQHEKKVPLMFTMVFPGAEYWCPYCGATGGIIGTGTETLLTEELVKDKTEWAAKTRDFIAAMGQRNCSSLIWEGRRIPPSELPKAQKEWGAKVIAEWKYEGES